MRRSEALGLLGEAALTVGAVVGMAVIVVTLAAARTGVRPLVVRSGSMEPVIASGSMVLTQRIPAAAIRPGDIVAVERPDRTRVMHRVVTAVPKGAMVELTLKGDANEDPDPMPVTVRSADRIRWRVPVVGQVMAWLATAPGGFVIGSLGTALLIRVLGQRPGGGVPAHAT